MGYICARCLCSFGRFQVADRAVFWLLGCTGTSAVLFLLQRAVNLHIIVNFYFFKSQSGFFQVSFLQNHRENTNNAATYWGLHAIPGQRDY